MFEIDDPGTEIYAEAARGYDIYNRTHTNWGATTYSVVHRIEEHVAAFASGVTNMGLVAIRGFWVDPDLRGRGVGAGIMAFL